MLELIMIFSLALLCAAIGLWALRRPAADGAIDVEAVPAPAMPELVPANDRGRAAPMTERAPTPTPTPTRPAEVQAPATTKPAPPVSTLAILEFEGVMGRVAVSRPEVVIGRHSEDDIRIQDVRVSRRHARLVAKHGGVFEIRNLTAERSEPNPMQINGETRELADIADGDIVTLGGVSFTFRKAA